MLMKLNINDRAIISIKNNAKEIVKLEELIPDWWGSDII